MNKHPFQQIEHSLHDLTRPKRSHTFWGFCLVLVCTMVLLYPKNSTWLAYPNNFMIGDSVDGFKNNMTTAWHVGRDTGYVHYRGMNYPNGEHILFTDMQPIFAMTMQWWNHNISDISGNTVAIINFLQLFSMLLGAGIIFLLFRKLHVPVWYAGLVSIGMVFLSPQYNRFDGHYGLSHTWVIPLLLLLLSNYEARYSRRYQSLLIGLLVWVAAQIHFYYLGISALFLGLYMVYQLILDPSLRNFRVRISHLIIMVIVPFALLNIWIHWANYTPDRPGYPQGFLAYVGRIEGVFMPYEQSQVYQWFTKHVFKIKGLDFEAKQNIGFVASAFTVFLLFARYRMFGKNWSEAAYHRVNKNFLHGILFSATLLLIFALGFPFDIKGMEWMVEYMGPLRQFRGLGRFVWAYYYVVNVIAFYVLWNVSTRFKGFKGRAPWFKWVIALGPVALLAFEAYTFQQMKPLTLSPNFAKRSIAVNSPDHWINKVDFSKFQALMPIPYYHIGSENLILDINYWLYKKMYYTAYHTGVPDLAVNLSRTPLKQMSKSVQLGLEACEAPAILDDFPDNRPIAIMIEPKEWEKSKDHYAHLTEKATLVYDSPEMRILSIELDSIRAYQRHLARIVYNSMLKETLYPAQKPWTSTSANSHFYYQSYDSLTTTDLIFQGKGAYMGPFSDSIMVYDAHLPKGHYNLSMWLKSDRDMNINATAKFFEKDRTNGNQLRFLHEGLRFSLRSIVQGWGLIDLGFEVEGDNSTVRIFIEPRSVKGNFYMDEVLIKSSDYYLYRDEPKWVVRNNYWYKRE